MSVSTLAQLPRLMHLLWAGLAGTVLLVAACGGGGSDSASRTPGNLAVGPISGFGSVIVNGVRYDDSAANVVNDDGDASSSGELKLGMMVQIQSNKASGGTAKAERIAFGGALLGPVSAVNVAGNSLTVLGQTVKVTETTVFGSEITGGLAGVAVGAIVSVHGLLDASTGTTVATRIELKPDAPFYRLQGVVSELNTTAKTMKLGGQPVSFAKLAAAPLPEDGQVLRDDLANGQVLRAKLEKTQVNGFWVALRLKASVHKVEDRDHNEESAEIEGFVTDFTSISSFKVNGLAVDASKATNGTDALKLGARVEVEGTVVNGVLVATQVEVKTPSTEHERLFELHGAITAVNTAAKTFVLRGLTVSYAGTVTYKGGTEANLVVGAKVEVKGRLSTDRTKIEAVRIAFES